MSQKCQDAELERLKHAIHKLETALEHPVGQQFRTDDLESKLADARLLLSRVTQMSH